jgi:hypothetical protein
MKRLYLLGTTALIAIVVAACGESTPIECNISTREDLRQGKIKLAQFPAGTNCDEMKKLAEEGKPLPTIGSVIAKDDPAAKQPEPPKPPTFDNTFVPAEGEDLLPSTDKKARVEELNSALPKTTDQRDPFAAIAGTVPPLPVLQRPAPPPSEVNVDPSAADKKPEPPDTSAAVGVSVKGVMQIGANVFAIVSVPGEKEPRYVKSGETLVDGKVTVSSIDVSSEPAKVILEQNGVQVPKEVSINPPNPLAPQGNPPRT